MIKDLRKLAVIAAAFMLAALPGYLLAASSGQTVEAVALSVLSPEMVFAAEADEGPGDDATEEDISETGDSEDQGKEVSISVSVGEHGSVNGHSSDYTETLAPGGTLSLAIQADTGYAISDILVNGVSLHSADQESVLGQSSAEEELEDLQDDLSIAVEFSEAAGSSDASAGPDEKAGEDGSGENGSGEDAEGQEDGQEEVQEDGDRDEESGEDLDEEDDEDAEESEEDWDGVDWDYDYDEDLADAGEDWEDEDDADWEEEDDDWDDEDADDADEDADDAGEDADGTDEDADDDDEEEDDADRDDKSEVSQDKEFTGQESTPSQSEIGTSDKSQIGDPPGPKTESEDAGSDTQDKTGSDTPIAAGSGDTETEVTDSETKEKSVTNTVYSRSDSSPKTGDRLPVIVVLILLSSLTMLAMIFCREQLHKERKVRP